MPGPADLEEDTILPFERDLAVVQAPRQVHDAERPDELLRIEPGESAGGGGLLSGRNRCQEW
ncbi:MAG TPA: hypothetical protein VEL48_12475, partial [Candidatus Acidoferrales bacterium]|nr:hypothetical protein [Candidatus Acidoferrales bacterium]